MFDTPHRAYAGLALTLIIALWLRLPAVYNGMPYFYDEDEGHHYNRVLTMVKHGDYNPHYFLKPSLHFYMRMPVTALAFLQSVRKGEARSLKDVVIKDEFGLANYSFSASQPRIAKWNRALSLGLSLATLVLVFFLCTALGISAAGALGATLVAAVSPGIIPASANIGVDVVVGFFAMLTVFLALKIQARPKLLWWCALCAGLTISSKYNAAPIVLVPLVAAIMQPRKIRAVVGSLLLIIAGFLLGTPYAVIELPLFLDHVAFELWHYGIAGHEGHMGEPGWPQAAFYLDWFWHSGVGLLGLISVVWGAWLLIRRNASAAALFLVFPLAYFTYMCQQKANFIRNMYLLIPFLAVLIGVAIAQSRLRFGDRSSLARGLRFCLLAIIVLPLAYQSILVRRDLLTTPETRIDAQEWLLKNSTSKRVAVSGQLQFTPTLVKAIGAERFDQANSQLDVVAKQGFDLLVAAGDQSLTPPTGYVVAQTFNGAPLPMRIVQNPSLIIFQKK